jgi:hypothetical protein
LGWNAPTRSDLIPGSWLSAYRYVILEQTVPAAAPDVSLSFIEVRILARIQATSSHAKNSVLAHEDSNAADLLAG